MISKLNNSKTPSNDLILNEHIKTTKHIMLPIYCTFFNKILDTGILPESWSEGIILPIYKNKGSHLSPSNYRPITILSCLGKLFTSALNLRLNTFLDMHDKLLENQAGFRQKYSTTDHIFVLNFLIELIRSQKKKFFVSYVDFSRAFDSIWRV